MGRYGPLLDNRADRYAEYARLLLEMAETTEETDEGLVTLAMSYLDLAIRERLNGGGNKGTGSGNGAAPA